jgi:hypothetical protein
MMKEAMLEQLQVIGIEVPRLYKLGFSHNNCGGFCVRAGQGHFAKLLETMPERYIEHEIREEALRDLLGKDVSILRRQRKGVKQTLTLRQLHDELRGGKTDEIDMFDIGGCGCFVNYDEQRESD